VSEVDEKGNVLATFTDVGWPKYLSTDSKGHILVADCGNRCIQLLNSELQQERVLVETDSQVKLWRLRGVHYNELTAQLYVVHDKYDWDQHSSDSSSEDDDDDDGGGGCGSSDEDDQVDGGGDDEYDRGYRISVFNLSAH